MSWGQGYWAGLLIVVAGVALAMVGFGELHRRRLHRFFGEEILRKVRPISVVGRRIIRDVLTLIALIFVVIALAEPMLKEQYITIEKSGVDIVVVLDVSRSMDARDVEPTRLERARREVLDLLEVSKGDRLGLVVYAGAAFPRMPLTEDDAALRLLLQETDTSLFQSQGSELGEAIELGVKMLENAGTDAGKALFVISDGEVHEPADALAAAEIAKASNVAIYGMMVGKESSPIVGEGGVWLRHNGATVMTTPSNAVLTDLARMTGGAVTDSVASKSDIDQIYGEIRSELDTENRGTVQRRVAESGFQMPLLIAFVLGLIGAFIGEGRRRMGALL